MAPAQPSGAGALWCPFTCALLHSNGWSPPPASRCWRCHRCPPRDAGAHAPSAAPTPHLTRAAVAGTSEDPHPKGKDGDALRQQLLLRSALNTHSLSCVSPTSMYASNLNIVSDETMKQGQQTGRAAEQQSSETAEQQGNGAAER